MKKELEFLAKYIEENNLYQIVDGTQPERITGCVGRITGQYFRMLIFEDYVEIHCELFGIPVDTYWGR